MRVVHRGVFQMPLYLPPTNAQRTRNALHSALGRYVKDVAQNVAKDVARNLAFVGQGGALPPPPLSVSELRWGRNLTAQRQLARTLGGRFRISRAKRLYVHWYWPRQELQLLLQQHNEEALSNWQPESKYFAPNRQGRRASSSSLRAALLMPPPSLSVFVFRLFSAFSSELELIQTQVVQRVRVHWA